MTSMTTNTPVTTILLISNLHCPSCSRTISELLWRLTPSPLSVSTSVLSRIVTVIHRPDLLPRDIVWALMEAEFEVDSIDLRNDAQAVDPDFVFGGAAAADLLPVEARGWLEEARKVMKDVVRRSVQRRGYQHLFNCELCQQQAAESPARPKSALLSTRNSRRFSSSVDIEKSLGSANREEFELAESRKLKRPMAKNLPPTRNIYEALISIGGMTCSVCTGKVAESLEAFEFVKEVNINLMNNSGLVQFEAFGDGKEEAAKLVEEVEDIGYDGALDRLTNLTPQTTDGDDAWSRERQVALLVRGMFCEACTGKILEALETAFPDILEIEAQPTVRAPILRISYIPQSPTITIRRIIEVISCIDPVLEVSVYHPPTIEERSREIQLRERNNYLLRLCFCVICAIPTFLIGVVWMALVSRDDPMRIYMEAAMWAGNVSRIEWALLIISTPVMFYAANPFHLRAAREIMALWRPGSPVPVFRRFYRFGSMNLLISLGVSISYFSSVAMLVLAAHRNPHHPGMAKGHTTTYFDSTVFLTMFLLMGRYLEAYSKAKTADGVNLLANLRPKEAVLVEPTDAKTPVDIEKSVKNSPSQEITEIVPDYSDARPVTTKRITADLLEVGDIVTIAQGSSPPADGVVISGISTFDETSLTGEARPVPKADGDMVYAGTINIGQVINARIVKISGETLLDEIVNVVREGQNRHAPIERIADRVTAYFVPVICFLAVTTWVVWLVLGTSGSLPEDYLDINEGGWYLWSLSFAIAVFVVACPCGIGLAAPCALHVGTGLAARHAILAKGGGEAFQEASTLDCVVFDKTGTLTHGVEPVVTDEEILFQDNKAIVVINLAVRLLEEGSNHPLARAMVNYFRDKPSANGRIVTTEEIAGKGSKGTIDVSGAHFEALIGNQRLMAEHNIDVPWNYSEQLASWQTTGKSVILFAIRSDSSPLFRPEFSLAAMFATTDPIREEAPFVIKGLAKSGIDVWMITGDNPLTASAVAKQVGIPHNRVIAGVLPTEKAEKVRSLQSLATTRPPSTPRRLLTLFQRAAPPRRAIVAMVGDGINDAPALSTADVGIAIGSGSDIAMQTSKFILVSSDLTCLLILTDLSRAVVRRVKFNFLWACVFNVVAIPLAAGLLFPVTPGRVRLEPVWAALAMALSSVSVICCSLLLKSRLWGVGFRPRVRKQGSAI